jgi:hypothetical protein
MRHGSPTYLRRSWVSASGHPRQAQVPRKSTPFRTLCGIARPLVTYGLVCSVRRLRENPPAKNRATHWNDTRSHRTARQWWHLLQSTTDKRVIDSRCGSCQYRRCIEEKLNPLAHLSLYFESDATPFPRYRRWPISRVEWKNQWTRSVWVDPSVIWYAKAHSWNQWSWLLISNRWIAHLLATRYKIRRKQKCLDLKLDTTIASVSILHHFDIPGAPRHSLEVAAGFLWGLSEMCSSPSKRSTHADAFFQLAW